MTKQKTKKKPAKRKISKKVTKEILIKAGKLAATALTLYNENEELRRQVKKYAQALKDEINKHRKKPTLKIEEKKHE